MNTNGSNAIAKPVSRSDILLAWIAVLLISDLPEAIWQALSGATPTWLFWIKICGLSALILLGWMGQRPHSLRPFFILLFLLLVGRKALEWLGMLPGYIAQGGPAGLLLRLVQVEGSRLLLTAVMIAALLIMGKRRQDFFLAVGDLKKWGRPGIILGLSIMGLTFLFFGINLPSAAVLIKAFPLILAALGFAALAAFDEEMRSRATLLPLLNGVVGKNHATLITAFYFGMGHYFGGVPSGVEGAIIAGGLGWLYATMMQETRGVFMSWFNHVLTNVPTFIFWAIGPVA